jgi:hypothetical protein
MGRWRSDTDEFEAAMVVTVKSIIFWNVIPYSLVRFNEVLQEDDQFDAL